MIIFFFFYKPIKIVRTISNSTPTAKRRCTDELVLTFYLLLFSMLNIIYWYKCLLLLFMIKRNCVGRLVIVHPVYMYIFMCLYSV